jgi:hypothetical protein
MNGIKKYKKEIAMVVCAVLIVLLLMTVFQSVKAFRVVLKQNMEQIGDAGDMLLRDVDAEMEQEEYDARMLYYWSSVVDSAQSINGINENLWFYKKYSLQKFEDFLFSQPFVGETDVEARKAQLEIISEIQEQIDSMEKAEAEFSLLSGGKQSASYYFQEIEAICEDF